MHPELIKGELRMRGLTCASVADELKVSGGMVSRVINRDSSSIRIEQYIASVIGQPADTLFPPRKPRPLLRRKQAAHTVAEGAAQ